MNGLSFVFSISIFILSFSIIFESKLFDNAFIHILAWTKLAFCSKNHPTIWKPDNCYERIFLVVTNYNSVNNCTFIISTYLIIEYYTESGILDAQPDKDGYVEIDEEAIADYLAKKAKKEHMGDFSAEDLLFVVQAHMDFEEEQNQD